MKRKLKLTVILLFALLFSTACGRSTDKDNASDSTLLPSSGSMASTNISFTDATLRISEYIPLSLSDTETSASNKRIFSDAYGRKLYILVTCTAPDTLETTHTLYFFDMDTPNIEQNAFHLQLPKNSKYIIHSMDVTGENELSFKLYEPYDMTSEAATYYLCKTDLTGALSEEITPFPDEENYPTDSEDGTTRVYHITNTASSLITERDDTNASTKIYRYDKEKAQQTLLDTLSDERLFALCSDGQELIYFVSNGYITQYNLASKTGERLCSIRDSGISLYGTCHLLMNDKGEIALGVVDGENPGIYFFTSDEITDSDTIRLTRLQTYGMEYVTKQAGFFSYNSGHTIQVEKEDDTQSQEAFRDRIMMEIVQGGGPELLWVSEADMRILAEKGALMDISQLLPEDIKKQLLPGVLQLGTVNNMQVAITPEVSFHTMVVSDSVWKENSWTVSDVLDTIESGKDWEWLFGYSSQPLKSNALFFMIFCNDLTNSSYVNLKQGISYFNQEEFIRTIEFCKKYGQADSATKDKDERAQMLRDGKTVAMCHYFYNGMQDFSYIMSKYEGACHIVGYPVNEGSGNYLYSEGYLVVNANAVHLEEIKEFFACLFDYDNQYTVTWSPVRKDVLRDRVIANYNGEHVLSLSTEQSLISLLENKPDGSSYLDEFMAFAESCVPQPYYPEDIGTILADELSAYFSGTKSAEEVAEIIHRRVQLYLDENN